MLAGGHDLASVVYKAGHHGSDTSSSRLFFNAVAPDIAVISSGDDNRYGHLHPAV
jgi:competence protein ComEC